MTFVLQDTATMLRRNLLHARRYPSLTLLVGSLGRAGLGEAVEQMGYAPVFRFTAALGLVAVAFVLLEWVRWRRELAAAER